jgi:hypothetical protein
MVATCGFAVLFVPSMKTKSKAAPASNGAAKSLQVTVSRDGQIIGTFDVPTAAAIRRIEKLAEFNETSIVDVIEDGIRFSVMPGGSGRMYFPCGWDDVSDAQEKREWPPRSKATRRFVEAEETRFKFHVFRERQMGEFLKTMPKAKGGAPYHRNGSSADPITPSTVEGVVPAIIEAGVTYKQSARAQKLATRGKGGAR